MSGTATPLTVTMDWTTIDAQLKQPKKKKQLQHQKLPNRVPQRDLVLAQLLQLQEQLLALNEHHRLESN